MTDTTPQSAGETPPTRYTDLTDYEQAVKAFHDHLNTCHWCERHPFELCPVGALALRKTATAEGPI